MLALADMLKISLEMQYGGSVGVLVAEFMKNVVVNYLNEKD